MDSEPGANPSPERRLPGLVSWLFVILAGMAPDLVQSAEDTSSQVGALVKQMQSEKTQIDDSVDLVKAYAARVDTH